MDGARQEAMRHLEQLMLDTLFPKRFRGADMMSAAQLVGLKINADADLSQEQLVSTWLALLGREPPKSGGAFTEQHETVGLYGYVAYLTLLIRLTKSYLAEQVSGSIFTTIHFDWSLYLDRHRAAAGLDRSEAWKEYDNLRDKVDQHPNLEQEKGLHGMLDDAALRSVAKRILEILEQFWAETKRKLITSS